MINRLLVEAAGVEPGNHIESKQLTDSMIARIAENAMISQSTVR